MRDVDELSGPVGYSDLWLWLAVLAVGLVVAYYVLVLWSTRRRTPVPDAPARPVRDARAHHLRLLDEIESGVADGRLSARLGHQRLSEVVRSFVDEVSPIPASTMALADLREAAPGELADTIALMYPPEFASDETGAAGDRFAEACARAKDLVATWT